MLDVPDVRYARGGGVAVAYQVIGSGPRELVFVPFLSNLMWLWQLPALRRFLERLAAETRLTLVNPRGMGLSDRPRSVSLEGWMDDIKAVLDLSPAEDDAIADATLGFVRGEAPRTIPDSVLATLLFTDLVGSTHRAAELGDRAWRDVLERHHAAVRREVARFRGAVIDTAGDGFFCRFDGPARAIACAREIVAAAPELGLAVRAGVHTGECELALEKLVGLSVVIGARVAGEAAAGEVLVSRTVKDLVAGSGLAFEDRGERELKGVPGSWRLYAVAA